MHSLPEQASGSTPKFYRQLLGPVRCRKGCGFSPGFFCLVCWVFFISLVCCFVLLGVFAGFFWVWFGFDLAVAWDGLFMCLKQLNLPSLEMGMEGKH